jgi:hypothetical protein
MNELMKFRQELSSQQITSVKDVFTLLDSHIERLKTDTRRKVVTLKRLPECRYVPWAGD